MIFFRLDGPTRLAMIGAALAAGTGCYSTHGEDGGVDPVPDSWDVAEDAGTRDDGDVYVVDDVPDSWEVRDTRDEGELDMVVDMVPYPNCGDVEPATLEASGAESTADYAVGQVRLVAPGLDPWTALECSAYPCLDVVPDGGAGTVSDVRMTTSDTFQFRYANPGMSYGEIVRLALTWRIYCHDTTGGFPETPVSGTAWVCRDDLGRLLVTGDAGECPTVVDDVPPPMARGDGPAGVPTPESLQIHPRALPDGTWHLRALGPAGTRSLRWIASGGKLRMLSDADALFLPDPEPGLSLVQVAAFTRTGVSIQVFRRRRG